MLLFSINCWFDNLLKHITPASLDYLPDAIKVVFPADEFGPPVNVVHTPIILADDNMGEAVEELFVVVLTLENAVHPDNTVIARSSSVCRIIDNDGRCQSSI